MHCGPPAAPRPPDRPRLRPRRDRGPYPGPALPRLPVGRVRSVGALESPAWPSLSTASTARRPSPRWSGRSTSPRRWCNAVDGGRINHAYLFSGPRGCGKTSSARILARSLNCEQGPTSTPCGVCGSCVALAPDGPGSLDVIEIDAASHGGVDDARDLRERAFFAPVNSRYKVYIVDEAHMVTTQGFNALLKVVEEPPEFLVFVFATTEPEKVLPTIRSRTHHYPFRLVPPTTLRGLLEKTCAAEGVTVEPTVFPLVVRAGGGSVRDSLSILDQLLAGAGRRASPTGRPSACSASPTTRCSTRRSTRWPRTTRPAVFRAVDRVVEAGHDPRRFATDLLDRLRDLIVLDAVPDAGGNGLLDCPPDRLDLMSRQAAGARLATLSRHGRHRARRPHRDARDDGAAAAAGAGLRPHAAARHRRLGRRDCCSGSSGSSGGCRSPASTPGARAAVEAAPAARAPVRPAPPCARPAPAAPAPRRRPARGGFAEPAAPRGRPAYVRPSQARGTPARSGEPCTGAAAPAVTTTGRTIARLGAAAPRVASAGSSSRRPRAQAKAPAPLGDRRTRRPAAAGARPTTRTGRTRRSPPRPGPRPTVEHPTADAGPPRAAAEHAPAPRGGEPTPVVTANPPEPASRRRAHTERRPPRLAGAAHGRERHKRTTEALLKSAQVHDLAGGVLTLAATSPRWPRCSTTT